MRHFIVLLLSSLLLASLLIGGCITPTSPSPLQSTSATAAPVATMPPSPTMIGNSDEAHVDFNYQLGTSYEYDGLKASPGHKFYMLQVKVSSDKPVQTSLDWFWMEYKVNETDSVQVRQPFTTYMFKYPTMVIGPGTGAARGGLLFELPDKLADGYPKPCYYMPLEEQQGQYKVYDKVYGKVEDVQ